VHLKLLPLAPFGSVLKLERRVSHEGMVSVGGNLYSVPDATRKRVVEVHTLANEVRIFEDGALIAAHPVLEGRHQRRVATGHRKVPRIGTLQPASHMACFQRSNASWRPDRSKSCSVSLGRSVMQPA